MRSVASRRHQRIPPCIPTMAAYCGLKPANGYPPGSSQSALLETLASVGGPIPALVPSQGPILIKQTYQCFLPWLPARDGLPDSWIILDPGERLGRQGTGEQFYSRLQDLGALTPENREILAVLRALRDHDLETAKPMEVERPTVQRLVQRQWAEDHVLDFTGGQAMVNLSARNVTQAGWDFVMFWDDPKDPKYPIWWRG